MEIITQIEEQQKQITLLNEANSNHSYPTSPETLKHMLAWQA